MAELASGLQRPVCSLVEIGKLSVVLTVFAAYVGMLSAYPSAIDRRVVLAGCLGIGLLGFLVVLLRSSLLGDYLL